MKKICSKCGAKKPETEFYIKDKTTERRHAECKDCYKINRNYAEHYAKYGELYRRRARERRQKIRAELQQKMSDYLRGKSCAICGENDAVVLEFDHINPREKSFGIAAGIRECLKWSQILEEIGKCQILCANCHKRKTAREAGWYRV